MRCKKKLTLGVCLMSIGTVNAAPATNTVNDVNTLTLHEGLVNVDNKLGISAVNNNAFTYMGDVSITNNLTKTLIIPPSSLSVFNSIVQFGKTDIVMNIDPGVTGDYVSGLRMQTGSAPTPELAATVTAELGAGSTITLNGNDDITLYGVNLEGGLSSNSVLGPGMRAYLNENTTVTLNNAGNYSSGIDAYLAGTEINTQDGLIVNVNAGNHATVYGISTQGLAEEAPYGGSVVLNGTSTINIVNGGGGSTGIRANSTGSSVTALKEVTVNNTTTDSTATLYGVRSNGGVIDFNGSTTVTVGGGSSSSAAMTATNGGLLSLNGGTINAADARAFYATGQNSVITGNAAQYDITGTLLSASGGVLDLSLTEGSTFTGSSLLGSVPGTTNLSLAGMSSLWYMTGDSALTSLSLSDSAGVNYVHDSDNRTFKTLTVAGNYHSDGGYLYFNAALNDDASETDKLVIEGNTSGTTNVRVTNVGGSGAQTLNGIELVQVKGNSEGEFIQAGRIVAGAYDYTLGRGAGSQSGNWYLNSGISPSNPALPSHPGEGIALPGGPQEPAIPTNPTSPTGTTSPTASTMPVERPEAGGYSANLVAANTLFVSSLHDRLGETQYIDALTGEDKVTSLWWRSTGGHTRVTDSHDQLDTRSNRYTLQVGSDVAQWSTDNLDRFHLGVMVGYGNSQSTTNSRVSGYRAQASVDGYNLGLYGTWYANEADKTGLYVDSWAQYSWFNNTVDGQDLETEKYKSKGMTTSVESGYTFKVGEKAAKGTAYFIQPKAQATWMGVKADEHKEANGTKVTGKGDGNVQTRVGVKAFMNNSKQEKDKVQGFQPFVEANWLHNTQDFGTQMDGVTVNRAGTRDVAELKAGVEGQLTKSLNVWGNVSQQVGDKGYSDSAVMLGVKLNF
ncbi:autotransporter outer membrane beta-barrel domain-containing protein [Yersinia enterocolitica]|nr:autotransporter outer membrane beta-barrel domain-containing protein [Yersinia enterocolitica]